MKTCVCVCRVVLLELTCTANDVLILTNPKQSSPRSRQVKKPMILSFLLCRKINTCTHYTCYAHMYTKLSAQQSFYTYQSPGDTGIILICGCVPQTAQSPGNAAPLLLAATVHHYTDRPDSHTPCRNNAESVQKGCG